MKKLVSILLTLAVAVSLSLVAVAPAAAQPTVSYSVSADDEFLYMTFDVEEAEETFLCVFIDTKEGGVTAEEAGLQEGSDYMITDPACGTEWDFWYLAKFIRMGEAYTWSVPDISYWSYEWGVWNCEVPGFEAEKGRNVGFTHYNFRIPLGCIEFDPSYGLNFLTCTGAGIGDWVSVSTGAVDMTTNVSGDLICITVNPSSVDFGEVYPGDCSTSLITITNCGSVDVDLSASTDSDFYNDNLLIDGIDGHSWAPVNTWSAIVDEGGNYRTYLKICVPHDYPAGVETGTLIFWAEKAA